MHCGVQRGSTTLLPSGAHAFPIHPAAIRHAAVELAAGEQ